MVTKLNCAGPAVNSSTAWRMKPGSVPRSFDFVNLSVAHGASMEKPSAGL
jgi:hypothetical protein